jgi:hypothetical protein
MYYIIENQSQFEEFVLQQTDRCFVELIFCHNLIHPILNSVSLVYIRPENSKKGYIIPITHNEAFLVPFQQVKKLISSYKEVFVRDKKTCMYFLNKKNLQHVYTPKTEELSFPIYDYYHRQYPNRNDINTFIPIAKHYERCEEYFNHIKHVFTEEKPIWFDFYNKAIECFHTIESNGIQVNTTLINDYFTLNNTLHSIKNNVVYSQYNTDTTTKRPSNRFNGINFAALPKDGSRQVFVSTNGKFIDIDIDSYHPTLIAKQIGYDFGDESIHEHMAKLYNTDYKTSKELTFKQLYGGIFKEYKHLEFFAKTQTLINILWEQFNSEGFISCPISNYRFYKNMLKDMNPQKLFNYWVQNLETSQNILLLQDILPILKGYKSKLVLYTYDAFLFDFDKDESGLLEKICEVFTSNNLKFKMKYGKNYSTLKPFTPYV